MGFFGGALSGYAGESTKMKGDKDNPPKHGPLHSLFSRKKKQSGGKLIPENEMNPGDSVPSYKRGGKVKKTGLAYVHKGEKVIPAKRKRGRSARKRR